MVERVFLWVVFAVPVPKISEQWNPDTGKSCEYPAEMELEWTKGSSFPHVLRITVPASVLEQTVFQRWGPGVNFLQNHLACVHCAT